MKNVQDIVSTVINTDEKLAKISKELLDYQNGISFRKANWLWTKCIDLLVSKGYDELTAIKLVEITVKSLALQYVVDNA